MAASTTESMFSNIIQNCQTLITGPEIFHQQNPELHESFKSISKNFYDRIAPSIVSSTKSKSLKNLLIEGFDDEQIWQQLEIQNKNAAQYLDSWFSEISNNDELIDVNEERAENNVESHNVEDNTQSSDEEMEPDEMSDDDSAEEMQQNEESRSRKKIRGKDFDKIIDNISGKKRNKSLKYKSQVDDQFFKLSKLEEFLRLEDLKEEKARDNEHDDDEEEKEEDIDLFQNISDEDMDDSEDESNIKLSKDYMYKDFFDPRSGDENESGAEDDSAKNSGDESSVKDSDGEDNVEDEDSIKDDDGDEDSLEEDDYEAAKTPFQVETENMKKKISEYEENMVTPKPWQLTGEVDVNKRPVDGLLDLNTDFELNAKPIIIQDKEFCEKLENIIKNTIKNKAYSDGVRQDKPVKEIIGMKKEIVIDQNKSKKGLAEEYEELYLKKQSNQEEENPKHQEIRKFMDSLFPQLYALFSHVPKPAVPDIKIVSNLPAITVEEVAPTSYSDGALLAPEEIKKRTGLTKGVTERDETDRNRERKRKKAHQKIKFRKDEKQGANVSTKQRLQVVKKLKQHKNTKLAEMSSSTKIKSSKDFFNSLQEIC